MKFADRLQKAQYLLAKKAKRKAQHRARVITKRTAAGKSPRADASNSTGFRAMRSSESYYAFRRGKE